MIAIVILLSTFQDIVLPCQVTKLMTTVLLCCTCFNWRIDNPFGGSSEMTVKKGRNWSNVITSFGQIRRLNLCFSLAVHTSNVWRYMLFTLLDSRGSFQVFCRYVNSRLCACWPCWATVATWGPGSCPAWWPTCLAMATSIWTRLYRLRLVLKLCQQKWRKWTYV